MNQFMNFFVFLGLAPPQPKHYEKVEEHYDKIASIMSKSRSYVRTIETQFGERELTHGSAASFPRETRAQGREDSRPRGGVASPVETRLQKQSSMRRR